MKHLEDENFELEEDDLYDFEHFEDPEDRELAEEYLEKRVYFSGEMEEEKLTEALGRIQQAFVSIDQGVVKEPLHIDDPSEDIKFNTLLEPPFLKDMMNEVYEMEKYIELIEDTDYEDSVEDEERKECSDHWVPKNVILDYDHKEKQYWVTGGKKVIE